MRFDPHSFRLIITPWPIILLYLLLVTLALLAIVGCTESGIGRSPAQFSGKLAEGSFGGSHEVDPMSFDSPVRTAYDDPAWVRAVWGRE